MKKLILLSVLAIFVTLTVNASGSIQNNYRWRNDDGNMVNATWKAGVNANTTAEKGTNIRLRLEIYGNAPSPVETTNIDLAYSLDNSTYTRITTSAANDFQLSTSTFFAEETFDETETDYDLLPHYDPGTGELPFGGGFTIESSNSKTFTFDYQTSYQVEYCIKATNNATEGLYYLKLLGGTGNDIDWNNIPQLTVTATPAVPLSNWPIYIVIFAITVFLAQRSIRFR